MRFIETLAADLRYALAAARREKGFFATAVLTIALGIGASTATISAAYAVLLKPLPYPDSDRIVQLWEEHPGAPPQPGYPPLANTTFYAWRTHLTSLDALGLFGPRDFTIKVGDERTRVHGGELSPAIFDILRVRPQAGRFFIAADDVPGHHDFVVLSDRLWRKHFNGSPSIVGQTIDVDGRPQLVVGIAPAGFAFPDDDALMWTPFDDPTILAPSTQGGIWLGNALGRLSPGATLHDVQAEGTAVARSIPRPPVIDLLFGKGGPVEVHAKTLIAQTTDRVRPAMLVLVAGVVIVLLVGCANVANLLLARGVARERELVLRTAIGASRGRLVRQLFTESMVLAACGGLIGALLGAGALRLAATYGASWVPRLGGVSIDATTMLIASALSMAVAVISGLVPALRSTTIDLAGALRGADRSSASELRGVRGRRLRRALLVGETALAVLLLVCAALLGRSFARLAHVDPGYTADGVLSARIFAPDDATPERITQFMYGVADRLKADARVVAAAAGNQMPFSQSTTVAGFDIPASVGNGRDARARVAYYIVTPGYAEALGLRLRAGRWLTAADRDAAITKAVVNDEFVRAYLSPDRVIGLQLPPRRAGMSPTEIVGVVSALRKEGNDQPLMAEMYVLAATPLRFGTEVDALIRTGGDPAALAPVLRQATREIDPSMVVGETLTLDRRLSESVSQPRFAAAMMVAFAIVGLAFATIGIYGALSYAVSQRTRELAIRAALGADRRRLLAMIVGEGLVVTWLGVGIGLIASTVVARLLAAMLFGIAPLDLVSFVIAALVPQPVVVLACLVPARAASRIHGAGTLKQ